MILCKKNYCLSRLSICDKIRKLDFMYNSNSYKERCNSAAMKVQDKMRRKIFSESTQLFTIFSLNISALNLSKLHFDENHVN